MGGWSTMSDSRLVGPLVLCVAACSSAPPATSAVAVELGVMQAILEVIVTMETAWNRGDFRGFMEGFANPEVVVEQVDRATHAAPTSGLGAEPTAPARLN